MSDTKLIVGLGNPGRDYEYTRHNLGFLVAQYLAQHYKLEFKKSSFTNGLVAGGDQGQNNICLLMPLTYMNHSGKAVVQAIEYFALEYSDILVVCDDMSLPYGQLRVRPFGSHGGNNGLRSIEYCLESTEFSRLRMGIDKPVDKNEDVDYVLSKFTKEEQRHLEDFVNEAARCCDVWLKEGIAKAMDQFNQRKKNGK